MCCGKAANVCAGFNPAEAEEWFRRLPRIVKPVSVGKVSIQPKPKNGLEVGDGRVRIGKIYNVSIQPFLIDKQTCIQQT